MRVFRHSFSWCWLVGAVFLVCAIGDSPPVAYGQDAKPETTDDEASERESDEDEKRAADDADAPDDVPKQPRVIGNTGAAKSKVRKEGDYGGVTPGSSPKQHRKLRKRKNAVSWVGFQARPDGGARLFVRMANELSFTQSVNGPVLTVHLEGARFRHRNTRRRLDVRFFRTVVQLITSKRVSRRGARKGKPARKAGIEIRIRFKNARYAGEASTSVKTEKDGYTYLYLDFQPGPSDEDSGSIKLSDPEG